MAEHLTVLWMLTAFATLGALLISGVAAGVVRNLGDGASAEMRLVPGLMTLLAAIVGQIGAALTLPVYRCRKVPPPRSVTIAAVAIFLAPQIVIVVLVLGR